MLGHSACLFRRFGINLTLTITLALALTLSPFLWLRLGPRLLRLRSWYERVAHTVGIFVRTKYVCLGSRFAIAFVSLVSLGIQTLTRLRCVPSLLLETETVGCLKTDDG